MHLPAPILDDRRFQEIVDEAKRRIPRYCPTWTDHNVSDPGITLIELFAWMTEQYLFRLNQVPEKNYVTFLDLIGARLESARPAKGDVTFTLAAAPTPERRIVVPAWTEVATERTEADEAVVFTTDADAEVLPATLLWVLNTLDGAGYGDLTPALRNGTEFEIWGTPPAAPQALHLGFAEDLSAHTLVLEADCDRQAIGIIPDRPPWRWEVWRGTESTWEALEVASDTTAGLNQRGEIRFYLPYRCQPNRIDRSEARTWLRCSHLVELEPGQAPFARSSRIMQLRVYTIGITVPVTHAMPVRDEELGASNGEPGQLFRLQHASVLQPEGPEEVVEVETEDGGWEEWQARPDFGDSGTTDRHCAFDAVSGQVEFGPAVRQTNGTEPQFGAIPPRGRRIRVRRYRVGGGVRGNVAKDHVKVLKTTLPSVQSVVNRSALTGGAEAQTLEDAKLRAPQRLRTRARAVTAEDFEYLARQVEGVGRVRCLQPRPDDPEAPAPGGVVLLVIPDLPRLEGSELDSHISLHETLSQMQSDDRGGVVAQLRRQLTLTATTRERLRDYLDQRRLLTTRVEIREPEYVSVTVEAFVRHQPKADPDRVRRDVKAELYRYLHPLYGGSDGEGWPFGQPLTIDKVYALIQRVRGVEYAIEVKLFRVDLTRGQILATSEQVIDIPVNGVVASYYHNVQER
jgi:predicted phage baseplate assembly protein